MENELDEVVRSKGYFWLASRPEFAGSWSQAGGIARQALGGMWWASVPKERWLEDAESLKFIMSNWIDGIGDARQELVFIGMDMNESSILSRFFPLLTKIYNKQHIIAMHCHFVHILGNL